MTRELITFSAKFRSVIVAIAAGVTATLLNLFVVPPLYLRFAKRSADRRATDQTS